MTPKTNPEVVITVGYPGSGKGTFVKPMINAGYQCFNRDIYGGVTSKPDAPIYDADQPSGRRAGEVDPALRDAGEPGSPRVGSLHRPVG